MASGLNYGFQVAMGRLLSLESFGELSLLLAVYTVAGFPFTSMSTFVTREATVLHGGNPRASLWSLFDYSNRVFLPIALAFSLASTATAYALAAFFKVGPIEAILFSLAALTGYFFQIQASFLQARAKFGRYSFLNVLTPALKLSLAVFLVVAGLGLGMVAFSIGISALVATAVAYFWNREVLSPGKDPSFKVSHSHPQQFFGALVASNLIVTVYSQLDLIVSRRILDPTEAGVFAAASLYGKLVLFLPGILTVVLIPMVTAARSARRKELRLLTEVLAVDLGLSAVYLLGLYLAPSVIVDLILGSKYAAASTLVLPYAVASIPLNLLMVFSSFSQARGSRGSWLGLLLATIAFLGGSLFWATSSMSLLVILASSSLLGLLFQAIREFLPRKVVK